MKTNVILTKGQYTLLENEKEYIVAYKYNKDTQSWAHGAYFSHFGENERKFKCLARALDCIRYSTDETFITRARMEELADLAIQTIIEDTGFEDFIEVSEMSVDEAVHFGVFNQYNDFMY
ncbi:MAG: hypothetical protein ACI4DK_03615 [Lachnospiraceae bacterium]